MAARTQIFCASGPSAVVTMVAAVEAGRLPDAERRVLLVCDDSPVPEAAPVWDEVPGFGRLRARFDAVQSWNETVRPFHPAAWTPRTEDVPLLERHVRRLWGLGDDRVELVLGPPDAPPALAVARVFTGAPLHVCAGGPADYGPTRGKLDPLIGTRVRQVLHLDLVPGLAPLLLGEFGVPARVVPADAYRAVAGEVASAVAGVPEGAALVVGESLAALGVGAQGGEDALHGEMLRAAARRGHRRVAFVPHPAAGAGPLGAPRAEAERLGVDLTVLDSPVPAELLLQASRPALVVGCSSAALFTASALYGFPVVRVGTERLLARLTPYDHPHRVALVLAEAVLPGAWPEHGTTVPGAGAGDTPAGGKAPTDVERDGEGVPSATEGRRGEAPSRARHGDGNAPPDARDGDAHVPVRDELGDLLAALSFAMRPRVHPALRGVAERYLGARARDRRWFPRGRLTALGLPGGVPKGLAFLPRTRAARRVVRRVRAVRKAVRG
ncbi:MULTISPECIES: alpha-2,8-polysialyltransferase family protein [unclassified Streptomyces]|uniref:alpha-2,8-polysialyltransferase family protein n=1 Tax=unclassified Streptomyces TaxID=2593676 RepID=UPI001E53C0FA|nr:MULTISPECIES: alpha-2,8-polysialyltransferase family protein [unclassified Streptomyces]